MDITRSDAAQGTVELTVTVPVSEFAPFMESALKDLQSNLSLPGFRKGKVPLDLARERIGAYVIAERGARAAIQELYGKAMEQESIEPAGMPQVGIKTLAPGNPLVFTIVASVLPEVKLPDYRALARIVQRHEPQPVTDETVTASLDWLRQSRATVKSSPIASVPGDIVTFDLQLSRGGVPVQNGSAPNSRVKLGSVKLLPGMEEQLIGVHPGDKKKFELSVPKDFWNKDVAGTTVSAAVDIKKVEIEELPEPNDAFAKLLGKFTTLAELKDSLQKGLEFEERERIDELFRNELVKKVAEQSVFTEPAPMVDEEVDMMLKDLQHTVQEHGAPWDQYLSDIGKTEEEVRNGMREQARDRVRTALVLDALAQAESLSVLPDELDREIKRFTAQFRSTHQAEQAIDPAALASYTAKVLRRRKATEFLAECAAPAGTAHKKT